MQADWPCAKQRGAARLSAQSAAPPPSVPPAPTRLRDRHRAEGPPRRATSGRRGWAARPTPGRRRRLIMRSYRDARTHSARRSYVIGPPPAGLRGPCLGAGARREPGADVQSTDPCCDPSAAVSFLGPYINSCREPGADVHRHDKPGKGTPRRLKHRAPSKALGANQAHKVSVRCVQFARDDCAPARNHAEMTPASFVSARRRLGRLRAERASQPMMGRGGGLGQWQGMSGASQKSLRASKK